MSAAPPASLPPLKGGTLALATIALSLATFMNVLDTTIANVSLPAISGDLGVAPNQGTWVITSFAVSNGIAVPLTGWLTQRFGQVRLFVVSVVLFVIASLLCGLSFNLEMLLACRVLQGAVAGPMIPLSQALMLQSYPRQKSSMALAMWSMTTLVAPVLGPILGGWITDQYSWPWIFYINIPVGLFAAYLTWRILHRRESPTRRVPIDKMGLALLVIWVGALQIMLDKGRELDWFHSTQIVVLALATVVGFAFFLIWELTEAHPIVDLHLFVRRNFTTGALALALGYAIFFGSVVLIPLWLQQYMGYTATWAGLVTAPTGIVALFISPVIGKILPRTDARLLASIAFFVFATTMFMRAEFTLGADVWSIVLPQIIQGAAIATFFVPLTAVTLSGLPHDRIPAASGLSNFARITAGAFGASLSTTLWENRANLHHAHLVDQINPYNPLVDQTLQAMTQLGATAQMAYGMIEREITRQAYMLSADDIFWASGVIFLALTLLIWVAGSTHHAAPGAAGGAH